MQSLLLEHFFWEFFSHLRCGYIGIRNIKQFNNKTDYKKYKKLAESVSSLIARSKIVVVMLFFKHVFAVGTLLGNSCLKSTLKAWLLDNSE